MKPNIIFVLAVCLQIMFGCSSNDFPTECEASQERCNELVLAMDHATGAEKERYRQLYLTEKHNLEGCIKQHQ